MLLVTFASHLHAWSLPGLIYKVCEKWATVNLIHSVSSLSNIFASLETWAWRNNKAAQTSSQKPIRNNSSKSWDIYKNDNTSIRLTKTERWSTQLLAGNRNTSLWELLLEKQVHVGLPMRTTLSSSQICLLKKHIQTFGCATWPLRHV